MVGGGVPHPVMVGGTPSSHDGEGYSEYPPPSRPGWGTPHHPDLARVPPIQTWLGYLPNHPDLVWVPPLPSRPGWGTPPLSRAGWGTPPYPDLAGVPPNHPDLVGVPAPPPTSRPGRGTPHPPTIQTWLGYPPPSRGELTNKLKTVPSPILRMRAVKIQSRSPKSHCDGTRKLTQLATKCNPTGSGQITWENLFISHQRPKGTTQKFKGGRSIRTAVTPVPLRLSNLPLTVMNTTV